MTEVAIRVENLSKQYRIGKRERYYALRDTLAGAMSAPFRGLSRLVNPRSAGNHPRSNNTIWALKDVSFEIKEGAVVGIIGRNGAGKSTLLKILSRITKPTEGIAEIHGRVGSLLEVGTGFHPELTGRENIYLNGAILGMKRSEIQRRFDEIVAFAEVERFIDTPVKHYSSGMYMRLAFAIAAHMQSHILLIDEVLAVGDAAFQKKCLGKMGDVAKEGRTVLFVSHNMAAVRSLCSRAFLLSGGQILLSGLADQCIDRYLLAASSDLAAEIDTAMLRRPSVVADDASLRITRVKLETSAALAILHTGRPISLVIEIESVGSLEDVVFGCSVHSSDNVRLFECRSVDSYGPIPELQPGRYTVRCTVPSNPLNPGFYTLHVGARCAHKGLDYLPDVMMFRVDSPERFDSTWLESPTGLMRVKSEWVAPEGVLNSLGQIARHG